VENSTRTLKKVSNLSQKRSEKQSFPHICGKLYPQCGKLNCGNCGKLKLSLKNKRIICGKLCGKLCG